MTTPSFAMIYASANFSPPADGATQYNTVLTSSPYLTYFSNNGIWTAQQAGTVLFKAYLTCTQTIAADIFMQVYFNGVQFVQGYYQGRNTSTYYNANTVSMWTFATLPVSPGDFFYSSAGAVGMSALGGIGNSFATCVFVPFDTSGGYPSVSGSFYNTSLTSNQTFTSNALVNWASVPDTFFLGIFGSSFLAKVTGFYEIMGVITLLNFTSTAQSYVQIIVNGAAQHQTGFFNYQCSTPSGSLTIPFSYKIRLTLGDTFYIQVNNGTGTTMTMAATNTYLHVLMTQQG